MKKYVPDTSPVAVAVRELLLAYHGRDNELMLSTVSRHADVLDRVFDPEKDEGCQLETCLLGFPKTVGSLEGPVVPSDKVKLPNGRYVRAGEFDKEFTDYGDRPRFGNKGSYFATYEQTKEFFEITSLEELVSGVLKTLRANDEGFKDFGEFASKIVFRPRERTPEEVADFLKSDRRNPEASKT